MQDILRGKAVRRLYQAKLEDIDHSLPHEMRIKMAEMEMDEAIGPKWREYCDDHKAPSMDISVVLSALGEAKGKKFDEKLDEESREEGYDGGDVARLAPKKESFITRLMKLLHG